MLSCTRCESSSPAEGERSVSRMRDYYMERLCYFLDFIRFKKPGILDFLPASFGGREGNVYNEFLRGKWIVHDYVRRKGCRRIMEVGVADGGNAERMIETAKEKISAYRVGYFGFDLFDEPGHEFRDGSSTFRMEDIKAKLRRTGAKVSLYRGDTREVLPKVAQSLPKMDLIFIDGGHSYKTVKSDWKHVRNLLHDRSGVFFDDYNLDGVRRVVDNIPRRKFSVNFFGLPPRVAFVTRKLSEL